MLHVTHDTSLFISEVSPGSFSKTVEENMVRNFQCPLEEGFTGIQGFAQ